MKKYAGVFLSLFAVLSLGIFLRSYPISLPQFREFAGKTVDQQIQQKVALEIEKENPELADLAKADLYEKALVKYKKENKKSIKQQKEETFENLKDRYQDKSGQTYMMELDGWNWARYVQNIDRLGRVGDRVIEGKQHDDLMLFPQGNDISWCTWFYYTSWAAYKVFSFFQPIELLDFLFYIPLFFISVLIIVLFFFCYRYWGSLTALLCCFYVVTAPIFIARSCAGWFDFDILTLLYPLLIVWTYILAYKSYSWPRSIGWVVLSACFLSLFCATWVGWPLILAIIAIYEFIVLINCLSERFQYKKDTTVELTKHLVIPGIFLFAGTFWIILIVGLMPLKSLFFQFKETLILNKPSTAGVWPNVLSTVGELKKGDYLSIARAIGGVFPLTVMLCCMLGVFLNIKKYSGLKREFMLIMVVWFLTMFYLCSRGIRFSIYLLLPLGLFLGWGVEEIRRFLWDRKWKLGIIPVAVLIIGMGFSLIRQADNAAKNSLPLMEDSWYSILTTIRKYTPVGSVLNSWWDYGDWFKIAAERPIIFDGQTQNTPQAYWMARVMLTDSEDEALGILRMLNNGGNSAFEIIDQKVSNPFLSISILKRAIVLDPQEGRSFLAGYLPDEILEKICPILYAKPERPAYFITDSSMIGKIYPISYLGNWDFVKVYLIQALRANRSKDEIFAGLLSFGLDRLQAEKLYQEALTVGEKNFDFWSSRRFSIASISYQRKSPDDMVFFNNGYIYNLLNGNMYYYSGPEERFRVPRSLFTVKGGDILEKSFPGSDSGHSTMVTEKNGLYKLVLLNPELARSMFVRMHFLNGKGLKHFSLFTREGPEDNLILVYEIKWD